MSAQETVRAAAKLRRRLKSHISEKLCDSGLIVDLADIREIAIWTQRTINKLGARELTTSELQDILVEVDVQLLFHLRYHLRSLANKLPKVLDEITVLSKRPRSR